MANGRIDALQWRVTATRDAGWADYQRVVSRRIVVVAASFALVLMPGVQLLEHVLGNTADLEQAHAVLRAPIMLAALTVLGLQRWRPDGAWPRPAAILFTMLLLGVGWALLLLHFVRDSADIEASSHALSIGIVAVALLATGGARDLMLAYLLPVACALTAAWWLGLPPVHVAADFAYPLLAMVVGAAMSELLFRGHVEVFVARRSLEQAAMTDPLTGLLNRRAMSPLLQARHAGALRHGRPYAVIMADLDHFKHVNDTHGHDVGDQVLKELSVRLRAAVRAEDHVARWGGEEFLVLLQGAIEDSALDVAEKIRARICSSPLVTSAGELQVTLSFGLAVSKDEANHEAVVLRADAALFEAKQNGRNRTAQR